MLLAEGTASAKALRQLELSTVRVQECDGRGGRSAQWQRQKAPGRQSLAEHMKGGIAWSSGLV